MEPVRFDRLARAFSIVVSGRGALGVLLGTGLPGSGDRAAGRRKRRGAA